MAPPSADGYIRPVSYDELVDANRAARIDPRSTDILEREKVYITAWREAAKVGRSSRDVGHDLAGLALSGGGIRSATFALGVTQAFAAQDLMRRFDYLSTVSGGGYLGSSLTWLTRDAHAGAGTFSMEPARFPYPIDPPSQPTNRRSTPAQDAQLIYLRQHGKYLTPGQGIDLVSAIAVVLRGLMLNLLVWLPVTAFVLLVIRWLPSADPVLSVAGLRDPFRGGYGWLAVVSGLGALLFAAAAVLYSLVTYFKVGDNERRYRWRRWFERSIRPVLWIIVVTAPIALLSLTAEAASRWLASLGAASIVGGILSAIGSFVGSRSNDSKPRPSISIVAPLGAVLLLYGFVIVGHVWAEAVYPDAVAWYHGQPASRAVLASLVMLLIALVTGWVVNVNLISVHRYYRDRLMEAFLPDPPEAGASGKIVYTGLAKKADVAKLQHFGEAREPTDPPYTPSGPYHLVNTNVILVDSQERSWRVRGGDSFVLSPLLCGSNATGWCRTRHFLGGDLSLATAMAISGAAANPYAGGGVFRNRPVAVLMSLVNLRLGYWIGHPDPAKRPRKGRSHFNTAWRELSGKLSESRSVLQLSDGGHFDNLGIYELIRRRARLIVACDGTADPKFAFSDFITLLARIEADFGARIVFDGAAGLELFMPTEAAGFPHNTQLAKRGYTHGRIWYSDGSGGDLIYITTTLFKGLELAALGYKAGNPDFPDQTTADQFFDDAQFEAYRQLGYSVGEAVLADPPCQGVLRQRVGFVPRPPPTVSAGAREAGEPCLS